MQNSEDNKKETGKAIEEQGEKIKNEAGKVFDEISRLSKKAKGKYDSADDKTKGMVIAGLIGAVAAVAGLVSARNIFKRPKKD